MNMSLAETVIIKVVMDAGDVSQDSLHYSRQIRHKSNKK